jgi:uncharacterized membrane-anchored protein
MKLSSLRRSRGAEPSAVAGTARLDRRTRSLARRLVPGELAVIDHVDIDRAAALALVESGVAGVVNAAPSVSGRYPSLGAQVLVDAGVALVDHVGLDSFAEISDGDRLRIVDDTIYRGDTVVGCGVRQDAASVAAAVDASKPGLASQLEAFSANAIEHLRRERDLLLDGAGVPEVRTKVAGRHVLVVTRAFDYRADLAALKTYIKEAAPVLVGVDDGADVLLAAGYRPDLIVTKVDEVSDAALQSGAEVVRVVTPDGRTRGADRLERLGVQPVDFAARGTTEDAALLLAHAAAAELIVLVGSHSTLLEFLDRGRSTMASAFLTRAAVGSRLVDAKAVASIYRNRVRGWWVALVVLVAVVLVGAAIATTPVGQQWWTSLQAWLVSSYSSLRGLAP